MLPGTWMLPLEAWRREYAVVAQRAERGEARLAILRRRTPDVLLADLLGNQARRPVGKRLRRRRRLAGHVARGNGPLVDGKEGATTSPARTEKGVLSSIPRRPRVHFCRGRAAVVTRRRSPTDRDERSGTTRRRHPWRRAVPRSRWRACCRRAAGRRSSQGSRCPSAETRDRWPRLRQCGTMCSRRRPRRSREADETSIGARRTRRRRRALRQMTCARGCCRLPMIRR